MSTAEITYFQNKYHLHLPGIEPACFQPDGVVVRPAEHGGLPVQVGVTPDLDGGEPTSFPLVQLVYMFREAKKHNQRPFLSWDGSR